jgi:glycosyltransferase involved in cell wall biosynthesis
MKRRRALVAAYDAPRVDRDGGSRRLFDLTAFLLDAGWTVDFVAANGNRDYRSVRILRRRGVAVHSDRAPTSKATERFQPNLVEALARSASYDLALLAFWPVAGLYLPILRKISPRTRVIVDSVDLHFLRLARRSLHETSDRQSPALLDTEFGTRLVGEMNVYMAADAVLTVSQKESELLGDFSGCAILAETVPCTEAIDSSPLPLRERRGILVLGSFQHEPNIEALDYLCKEVLPRVDPPLLASHPVYVVGTGVNEQVRSITKGVHGVRLVGWVPSVAPYFHRARISAVPLLYGAGTKTKMIQALMSGTPTVSTSTGTEGLDLVDEEHVLVANAAEPFARGIERLLRDDETWHRLAVAARERIARTHSCAAVQDRFLQVITSVIAREPKKAMLPQCSRDTYERRINYRSDEQRTSQIMPAVSYHGLVERIRQTVECVVAADATVVVVSKGDDALLELGGRRGWHFPQTGQRKFAGFYPADSSAAIDHLESLRQEGGDYLLFPATALWWLQHYQELARYLDQRYQRVLDQPDTCLIYCLRDRPLATHEGDAMTGANGSHARRPRPSPSAEVVHRKPSRGDANGDVDEHSNGPIAAAKLIAFYLPQYHPIPENSRWWGEGFTEWTNVSKARSLFAGHHQPRIPADLGYYDLRLDETRIEQAALARRYGIHGFCYYHYWFNGKRLLERPFNEVLRSGNPDFPFCLCWANEPWSRRWDGSQAELLQQQSYSPDDDLHHIRWLLDALGDPRAITLDARPVFLVYRADQLPQPDRTTDLWRRRAEAAGLKGLYLIAVETGWDAGWDATRAGFDAKLLFQPQFSILGKLDRLSVPCAGLRVYDYDQVWPVLAHPEAVPYLRYDTVFSSWDNTPRRGEQGWVVHGSSPEAYAEWLRLAIERAAVRPIDQRAVFINAWNEWAEGAHLEPDRKFARAYLEATEMALMTASRRLPHEQRQRAQAQPLGLI